VSVLSIVEWVIWGIVFLCGLWFAIGIRTAAVRHAPPPLWPTLIMSFYLVFLPLLFLFLPFSKLHILWMLFILYPLSFMAGVGYMPIVSQLLIWPAYIYACILIIGTGMSLSSPSKQSPWAARDSAIPLRYMAKGWFKGFSRKLPPDVEGHISKLMESRGAMTEQKDSPEEDNVDVLYEKLWQEGLSEIVHEATAKEIATELLIPDRIDSFAFAHNYAKFLRRGMPSFEEAFFRNEAQEHSTPSITDASNPLNYILSFPDWFIAAYPDVFLWFGDTQNERVKGRGDGEDVEDIMEVLVCDLFGIDPEDKELETDDFKDSDRKWLPKWLNNLVSSYKQQTGKKPETSVDETNNNAVKEIYDNIDIVAAMAESGLDNFTIIARKTTMYYLELSKNYRHRFRNEACLLAAAGVCDAQVYIFLNKNIEISEIVDLAEKVVVDENDLLTEFIASLEAKMFTVDTPELTQEMVEISCQEEKPRIHKEIQRVRKEYKRDPFIAKEVQAFMESPNFSEMRDQLGIR